MVDSKVEKEKILTAYEETKTNADVSHANTLPYKIKVFFSSLKRRGVVGTAKKMAMYYNFYRRGVDLSSENLFELTLVGEHKEHGTAYLQNSYEVVERVIKEVQKLNPKVKDGAFLDYGSGKGLPMIIAQKSGFKRVIGVEFAVELYEVSALNMSKLGIKNFELHNMDAAFYTPPEDVSLILMFNPFDHVVMEKVSKQIILQKDKFVNDVYIVYINPTCNYIFTDDDNYEFIENIVFETGEIANIFKLKKA